MIHIRSTAVVAALAVLGTASPASATFVLQQFPSSPASAPTARAPGWLGIFYKGDGQGRPDLGSIPGVGSAIRVSDVAEASPALRAGLQAGDLIVAINRRSVSPDGFRSLDIREGDRIQLRLLREGRPVELSVVAGRPPDAVRPRTALDPRDPRIDSLRTRILVEMDSILVHGSPEGHSVIRFVGPGGQAEFRGPVRVEAGHREGADPALPFQMFFLRRDELLPEERFQLGAAVERAADAAALQARSAELRTALDSLRAEGYAVRVEVAGDRARVVREQAAAEQRMVRTLTGRVAPRPASAPPPPAVTTIRPLTPYILGQRVVAGAELTPLNRELAEYFQGEEGLLVLQVLEGSPARDAGMMAGDIVTRIGRRPVRTLDEARAALEGEGGAVQVTLVRKGRTVLLALPR